MNAPVPMQVIQSDRDAEDIGALYARARSSIVDSVRYQIECGRRLAAKKASLAHGEWLPWLQAHADVLGFTGRHTATRLMRAANDPSTDHLTEFDAVALSRQTWGNPKKEERKTEVARRIEQFSGGTVDDLAAFSVKCGCIYADPPWNYGNQSTRGSNTDHYVGMSVDEICALPVGHIAADNAHLHLWTTNGFLFDAQRVMDAWGFTYKSCFVWVKPQMGMGNYWRVSHEFLLLGVRGSLSFADRSLMSWAEFDRRAHSQKPEEIRALIERASPGPRLELFARRRAHGWYSWGNEVEKGGLLSEAFD